MALLERVSTLIRANLNDLVDQAEHPEKMIKQVILDMQNQLMQVKTQVALAMADQHATIPMRAGVESINVAVTAALILYEARRQRGDTRNGAMGQ